MLKKFSKFIPQIVAFLFLAGFAVYAWTEPPNIPGAPPAGNVEPPINVGSASQYKSGALGIGGVLRVYSDAVIDGAIQLKETTAPAPAAGYGKLYVKSDGYLYFLTSGGTEIGITAPKSPVIYNQPGTYTFVIPSGVTTIFSSAAAGGGGGGGGAGGMAGPPAYLGGGGGGGGSQAVNLQAFSVTPGASYSITVGQGGLGGAGGGTGPFDCDGDSCYGYSAGSLGGSGGQTKLIAVSSGATLVSLSGGFGGGGGVVNGSGVGGSAGGAGGNPGVNGSGRFGGASGSSLFSPLGNGGTGGNGAECPVINCSGTGFGIAGAAGNNGFLKIEW